MRGGQLVSKSRYLGAQMLAYLEGDLWLENARQANGLAKRLVEGLKASNRIRMPLPADANEITTVLLKYVSLAGGKEMSVKDALDKLNAELTEIAARTKR